MGIYDGLLRVSRNLPLVHMNLRLVHMNALCFSSNLYLSICMPFPFFVFVFCRFFCIYVLLFFYLYFATAVKWRCLLRKRFSACSAAEALSLNLPEYLSPHKPNPLLAPHCTSRAAKRSLRCPLPSQNNEILKHRNPKNYSYIK